MEFDTDWIWLAIFVGVMIVRAIGSRIARAAKSSQPRVEKVRDKARDEGRSPGFGSQQVYHAEKEPKPIEPR